MATLISAPLIAASILSADFARLGEEVNHVIEAGADLIHFDVMDRHFVPNLTMGPMICKAIKPYCKNIPIDVHLMTYNVESLIEEFALSGADNITFHVEATHHLDRTINLARSFGVKVGLALNPATPISALEHVISEIDLILIMAVNPGFGGQKFISYTLNKLEKVREMINDTKRDILLAVDGGINIDNIIQVAKAGANLIIAGNSIFSSADYQGTINKFKDKLTNLPKIIV